MGRVVGDLSVFSRPPPLTVRAMAECQLQGQRWGSLCVIGGELYSGEAEGRVVVLSDGTLCSYMSFLKL